MSRGGTNLRGSGVLPRPETIPIHATRSSE